ncbi:MAG: hypothetical protein FJ356_01675 [Thaumarchaeota archaeon]|nr:hypothetical protein [Nitrososphaerota archaeon]
MNKKLACGLGAIAAVAAIAITVVLTIDFENDNTVPLDANPNLGLVVNTPTTATTLEELNSVYEQAATTGVGRNNLYMFWNILEPEKDQFNFKESDILMSFNKKNNMQVTLFFSVVNGPALGPFPDWMGRQALTENLADNTVRVLDVVLSRYNIIDTVIIGAEIEEHFRYNEGGVENYKHFFNIVYEKIKQKHPNVKIGSSFALHAIFNKNLEPLVSELGMGDFVAFSYFPVDSLNDITKTPYEAQTDLEKIFDLVPDKKVALFEISWSTSEFVNGNEQDQAEFLKNAYDFYRKNESKIEFFTWYRQYDRPEGSCFPDEQENIESKITVGGGSGLGSSEFVIERLGYYLCNAGLIDVKGTPKPSWLEFKKQIQQ